jgi:5-aminolevulinate synthase
LRITPTPLHDDVMLEELVSAVKEVWEHLGISRDVPMPMSLSAAQ